MSEINLNKREQVKKGLIKILVGGIMFLGLSNFVSAGFIQKINGLDYLVEGNTEKNVGSVTRNASDLITSVVVAGRTITVNRDVNDLVESWEDNNYEWNLTRGTNNEITNWSVNSK